MAEYSNTGSIQAPAVQLTRFAETYPVFLSLKQGAGATLKDGDEVVLSANNTVVKRLAADGTKIPIGTVTVGKSRANNPYVTVATVFNRDINGAASGAIATGDLVRQTGVESAAGRPTYVKASAGDIVIGIALTTAADQGQVRVGVLRSFFKA